MGNPKLAEVIGRAPWRKAGTYRYTWPHEYVLSLMDGQRELFELVCARFRAGEGVAATFSGTQSRFLFIGDYKYWLTAHWDAVDLDDGQDYVLNRVRRCRESREVVLQPGDLGAPGDCPWDPRPTESRKE